MIISEPVLAANETDNSKTVLFMTRLIAADRRRVYEAWTNPEMMRKWTPPGTMETVEAAVDLRVGGRYRIAMRGTMAAHNGEEKMHGQMPVVVAEGKYLEVVPNEKLRYTWCGSWNPSEETIVTVVFRDANGGTEIQLQHEGFHSEQGRQSHATGWASSLEKFADLFS